MNLHNNGDYQKMKQIYMIATVVFAVIAGFAIFSEINLISNLRNSDNYEIEEVASTLPIDLMGKIITVNGSQLQLKQMDIFEGIFEESINIGLDLYEEIIAVEDRILELSLHDDTVIKRLESRGFDVINKETVGREYLRNGNSALVFVNYHETELIVETVLVYNFLEE